MNLQYLIKYKSFNSMHEMDEMVKEHINTHRDKLTEADKEVLYCLAAHSLSAFGACHLKAITIANEIGVSERTVYRSTKKLESHGIISKHKTVKRTGNGATIYVIAPKIKCHDVSHSMSVSCQSLEIHGKPVVPTDSHGFSHTVTKNLSTSSFNPYVNKNVSNNVNACDSSYGLAIILQDIYRPQSSVEEEMFNELKKIAFGRIKQYMAKYKLSYPQIEIIVVNCMKALVSKNGVRNKPAMFSGMIKRQVEQLVKPSTSSYNERKVVSKEKVPDWFNDRNSAVVSSTDEVIDFEIERQKILEKIGGF